MHTDESKPDLPDQWERGIAQKLVRLTTLAWGIVEELRETWPRLSSHGIVLVLVVCAIALSRLEMPVAAQAPRQPRKLPSVAAEEPPLLAQAESLTRPVGAAVAAPSLRPLLSKGNDILTRQAAPLTQIPDRPREAIVTYTVRAGDTLFGIALLFNLAPETILWANADLKDNPDMMNVGMTLDVPPVDGLVHIVEAGDSVEGIAEKYKVPVEDIVNAEWNSLRVGQQPIEGQSLIVPGGKREMVVWQLPIQKTTAAASQSSASKATPIGFCEGAVVAPLGTGTFIWPEDFHRLGGNPYAWWHRAIDISGKTGNAVYASDSGTVVWAGWNNWGYGYLIVLDHGNGWQTWYAHLSQIHVYCGQQLYQGAVIGAVGSTGNSTGPHLHFETRYNGDLPNPLNVLP
ncbi:MAG: M23 family metallopeptidase [Thermoflexales bacterium]|nr:M23 family metallopeptidase [Thermoflexales bacterium]